MDAIGYDGSTVDRSGVRLSSVALDVLEHEARQLGERREVRGILASDMLNAAAEMPGGRVRVEAEMHQKDAADARLVRAAVERVGR